MESATNMSQDQNDFGARGAIARFTSITLSSSLIKLQSATHRKPKSNSKPNNSFLKKQ